MVLSLPPAERHRTHTAKLDALETCPQKRTVVNAGLFLDGVLIGEPRKTGWMRAEAAGDPWLRGRCA